MKPFTTPIKPAPAPVIDAQGKCNVVRKRLYGLYDEPSVMRRVTNECRNTREDALQRVDGYELNKKKKCQ